MAETLGFRRATVDDLAAIVALLADDVLGAAREDISVPVAECYVAAFAAIDRDPCQLLLVADTEGSVVGCLQLTFIPGLSHQGAWRGQIESVRVASTGRGRNVGRKLMLRAIEICAERGCRIVQLTTAVSRHDARRFYEQLGFEATHTGMKLALVPA